MGAKFEEEHPRAKGGQFRNKNVAQTPGALPDDSTPETGDVRWYERTHEGREAALKDAAQVAVAEAAGCDLECIGDQYAVIPSSISALDEPRYGMSCTLEDPYRAATRIDGSYHPEGMDATPFLGERISDGQWAFHDEKDDIRSDEWINVPDMNRFLSGRNGCVHLEVDPIRLIDKKTGEYVRDADDMTLLVAVPQDKPRNDPEFRMDWGTSYNIDGTHGRSEDVDAVWNPNSRTVEAPDNPNVEFLTGRNYSRDNSGLFSPSEDADDAQLLTWAQEAGYRRAQLVEVCDESADEDAEPVGWAVAVSK